MQYYGRTSALTLPDFSDLVSFTKYITQGGNPLSRNIRCCILLHPIQSFGVGIAGLYLLSSICNSICRFEDNIAYYIYFLLKGWSRSRLTGQPLPPNTHFYTCSKPWLTFLTASVVVFWKLQATEHASMGVEVESKQIYYMRRQHGGGRGQ